MSKRWVGSLELTVDDDTGALLVKSVSGGGIAGPVENQIGPIAPGNPLDIWVRNDGSGRIEVMLFDSYGNYLGTSGDALHTATYDGNGSPISSYNGALWSAILDTYGNPINSSGGSLYTTLLDIYGNPVYSSGGALYTTLIDNSGQQVAGETNENGQRGLSVSPLMQVAGSEGNLAYFSALAAGDNSGAFYIEGGTLTVLGNVNAATTLTLLLSADGSTFYAAETRTLAAASDFTFYLFTAARYCRLQTSDAVTLTATALSRR
ncbi:hypothetical protein BH11PLA2_BH11PLA2_28850 [soil metagenome]